MDPTKKKKKKNEDERKQERNEMDPHETDKEKTKYARNQLI